MSDAILLSLTLHRSCLIETGYNCSARFILFNVHKIRENHIISKGVLYFLISTLSINIPWRTAPSLDTLDIHLQRQDYFCNSCPFPNTKLLAAFPVCYVVCLAKTFVNNVILSFFNWITILPKRSIC